MSGFVKHICIEFGGVGKGNTVWRVEIQRKEIISPRGSLRLILHVIGISSIFLRSILLQEPT